MTYSLHSIIQIIGVDHVSIQQAALSPPRLPAPLLVDHQPRPQLLSINVQESPKLLDIHGGVQSQVRLDSRAPHVGLDLLHENLEVMLERINVKLWVVKVWWGWGDELRTSRSKELLVDWKSLLPSTLKLQKLIAVLLAKRSVDGVV